LRIATFADADGWQRRLYDAELAGVHDGVYRIATVGVESAEIKTAQRRLTDMAFVKVKGCW
jgi:hypothetical protein